MLKIVDLKKKFGDKEVLRGLNLSVPEGSIFGFIGKNGAGKTTTMKTVLGLLAADAGEIFVAGEKVSYGQTATNRFVGYLPDVPEFYSFMTAAEYLEFCGKVTGMGSAETKARCDELLKLVGLKGESHRIKGFSRGMKQRLGIAQALFGRPKLLICDEPTSALDPVGRKEILDILFAIREQTTVLFSTHILSDVERICTDVAFLADGVVSVQGKLADVKSRYRADEHVLEVEQASDIDIIMDNFAAARRLSDNKISFATKISDGNDAFFDVLRFVAERKISVVKFERLEPSLESLFMDFTGVSGK